MDVNQVSQGGQANAINMAVLAENSNEFKNTNVNVNGNENLSKDVNEKDVNKAIDKINKFLDDKNTHAEYSIYDKFKNTMIVKIVDNRTGQVVQEIPPKKILDMVAKMCEMVGLLFDKKA